MICIYRCVGLVVRYQSVSEGGIKIGTDDRMERKDDRMEKRMKGGIDKGTDGWIGIRNTVKEHGNAEARVMKWELRGACPHLIEYASNESSRCTESSEVQATVRGNVKLIASLETKIEREG